MFLGNLFEYYNFKRARLIGELGMKSIETMSGENQLYAEIDLLRGNTLFWNYNEAYDRTVHSIKMAVKQNMPSLAVLLIVEFSTRYFLPFGRRIGTIRDLDEKFKELCNIPFEECYLWRLVISSLESMPSENHEELEYDPSINSITQYFEYAALFKAMIHDSDKKKLLYQNLKSNCTLLQGSWMFIDLLIFGMIIANDSTESKTEVEIEETSEEMKKSLGIILKCFDECVDSDQKCKLYLAHSEYVKINLIRIDISTISKKQYSSMKKQ
jgi:hypothetical protein